MKSRKNNLFARIAGVFTVEPEGNDPGGGGGNEPVTGLDDHGGGAHEANQDYGDSFDYDDGPSQEEAAHVRGILDTENDPNARLSMKDIGALIGFNPPIGPKKAAAPVDPNAPANPNAPAAATPPVDPNAPAVPPVQPAAPTTEALTAAIVAAIKGNQPQAPANPNAPAAPAQPKAFYGDVNPALNVSETVLADLFNPDDPAKAAGALNAIINGIGNQVMQDVAKLQVQMMQAMMQRVPQMVQTQSVQATNTQKFFSKFAELDKPALRPTVNAITSQIVEKHKKAGTLQYNDALYDEIGNAIHAYVKENLGVEIPRAGAQPIVSPAPRVAQQPKRKETFYTPGGARPPAGPNGNLNGQSADLRDLVL